MNKKYFDFYFLPQSKSSSQILSLTYFLAWPPTWICVTVTASYWRRWGCTISKYLMYEIWPIGSKKSFKLLPPDVRFQVQNAPNAIAAGAPSQTSLGELTSAPQTH